MFTEQFFIANLWILALLVVWTLPWKGVALWKSAHLKDKRWFIALLIINTVGILEILYIFVFSRRKSLKSEPTVEMR